MNLWGIGIAVATLAGCGLIISIFLSVFARKFAVKVNKKEEDILSVLPGNNCGGCGYPGCSGLAAAIASGNAPVGACPVGGAPVAEKIAAVMGVDAGSYVKKTAYVKCSGTCDVAEELYEYTGPRDCKIAAVTPGGGSKKCDYGCLGFGSCKNVCESDAISILDGVAVIDPDKCTSCGKCVNICPKGIIELVPYDSNVRVACSSKDRGPVTMKACKVGCVGCGICVKTCEYGAVNVEDSLARIDYEKCTGCGACAEKCPKKIIAV